MKIETCIILILAVWCIAITVLCVYLTKSLRHAANPPHTHQWLPTTDGLGYADDMEIHCRGCGKFMHHQGEKYVPGRNPHRRRCVKPQREISLPDTQP